MSHGEPTVVHPDHDDAIRLRVGERFENERVDDAEDGGGRPDAESDRGHRDDGKAFRLAERSESKPRVLAKHVEEP